MANEPVDAGNVVVDMAISRIAHGYDLRVTDIIVHAADIMPTDDFTWGIDLAWSVQCQECDYDAVIGETTKFTAPMCRVHLDEAYEQDLADQHNDDVALGLA